MDLKEKIATRVVEEIEAAYESIGDIGVSINVDNIDLEAETITITFGLNMVGDDDYIGLCCY